MLRCIDGHGIRMAQHAGIPFRGAVYNRNDRIAAVGPLRVVRKIFFAHDVLLGGFIPDVEEDFLKDVYRIAFNADMHIAPGAYLGESVDIIVGNIHSAGISYFAVDDCNLPMVAVSRMIDIRNRVHAELAEHHRRGSRAQLRRAVDDIRPADDGGNHRAQPVEHKHPRQLLHRRFQPADAREQRAAVGEDEEQASTEQQRADEFIHAREVNGAADADHDAGEQAAEKKLLLFLIDAK